MAGRSANSETASTPDPKRRKVRKGTQSCWECKRRKVRCTFAVPTDSTCDGCRSRRVKCVSQEFCSEQESGSSKTNRLERVEAAVEQLARKVNTGVTNPLPYDEEEVRAKARPNVGSDIPASSTRPLLDSRTTANVGTRNKHKYDELCGALLETWPNRSELDLILSAPVSISVLFHGIVCMPYSSFQSKDMPSPQDILQLPPPGSHPVFIARKLLMLGSFLQGVPRVAAKELERRGVRYREVMFRVVEAASRLVTRDDDLVGSLEGIECIMIESMYQNNAGNLRQAWLTNRRAMAIAQLMGIQGAGSSTPTLLDVKTRQCINPEYMWLRLVSTDRYLSLILGLPHGSQENPFAASESLKECAPMERMERIETMVGGLIIQRNKEDLRNTASTGQIDKLLQDAAAIMPAQWWLVPDAASFTGSDSDAFRETLRITYQFAHWHLLAQLHLPYLLQSSADRKYDCNKITAVNASREIISRFVSFAGSSTVAAYCRGIDFLAFIASTTLCLAHINARSQHGADMNDRSDVLHSLVHQRLGDRGLMERTLRIMENMAQVDNDHIASRIAGILQRLLAFEAAADDGDFLNARFCTETSAQEFRSSNDDSDTLQIDIPHVGIIILGRDGVVRYPEEIQKPSEETIGRCPAPLPLYSSTRLTYESEPASDRASQQPGRGKMSPAYPPAVQVGEQAPSSTLDSIRTAEESRSTAVDQQLFDLNDNPVIVRNPPTPDLAVELDEWALQGVDMALFDNLFVEQGTSM
ncbi:hypothetical protein H2200_002451 [Cladophialophora chaetospira]|uniref:Zn(2)-C6 fungal-type domain-containing protein n=1 Tax=Cladophialophora chaetospira TaxID=386627 RepID=A0AA39CNK4_9EURO|nr:hypothetical protein H2200_002451 [Cladophialophora chaetospira]